MGLAEKKPLKFNLWDGLIKPVEWYLSDEGKNAFFEAFANADEMNEAIRENNWISIIFKVCYQSSKKPLAEKKNWLIKYFYELVLSQYSMKMASNEHTLVLMTAVASLSPICPYPDCLGEEKNPVLYFFSHVKNLLPDGYSEVTYPILKDIVHYVYNAYSSIQKDVSQELRLYDKSLYVDERGKPQKYGIISEKLSDVVQFPEFLHR